MNYFFVFSFLVSTGLWTLKSIDLRRFKISSGVVPLAFVLGAAFFLGAAVLFGVAVYFGAGFFLTPEPFLTPTPKLSSLSLALAWEDWDTRDEAFVLFERVVAIF